MSGENCYVRMHEVYWLSAFRLSGGTRDDFIDTKFIINKI